MALTSSFKASIAATPQPGQAPAGQPMNPDQFKTWVGSSGTPASTPSYPQQVASSIGSTFQEGAQNVTQDVQNIPKNAATASVNPQKPGLPETILATAQGAGHVAGDVASTAGKLLGSLPGFQQLAQGFGTAGKAISDQLMKIPEYSQAFDHLNTVLEQNPELAKSLGDVINTASLYEGGKAEPTITGAVSDAANTVKTAVKEGAPAAEAAPKNAVQVARDTAATNATKAHDMIDKEVRNVAEKYGDVGKALNNAEVTKGTEPIKVLASYPEGKALPSMSKGGKMNSLPAINYLRTQVSALGKIKGDLVDTAKQNISVKDFQKTIEDKIDASNGSQVAKDSQKADIAKEMERLSKSYPDGIPTKEMDKIKTEQANESSSYKTTGFPSRFAPDTHSTIADTARKLVEKQGGEAPINELNKWIQSHHDAIKVLEKMHGKTPHGGMFSRHVGGIAGEVAGLAGGMALGHPFLGAMAGRGASEVVNNILSSHFISNPLKRSIIDTMKSESPEVIQKAKDFLNQEAGASSGSPIETPESPSLPTSVPETTAKATELPPEAPPRESTLSFLKNNIGNDKRGFMGAQKLSTSQKSAIKAEITRTQKELNEATRVKSPHATSIKARLDGYRKLLR